MHTILEMDEHNYDEALPEIRRTAVRGVIFRAGKLLMIRSSFGEVKFPGGGQEQDENDDVFQTGAFQGSHILYGRVKRGSLFFQPCGGS